MKVTDILKPPFKTPFDGMTFYIDPKDHGGAIRDTLIAFENELGRVVEMATVASYRADMSKAKWQFVANKALEVVETLYSGDRKYTSIRKEALANTVDVTVPGDTDSTTPYIEEQRYLAYKYVADRGKDKVREINSAIDLGRSVLSWDKEEISRLNG
jgi:hypothetical protein